jgi:glutathione reductase (NADPH)
MVQTFDLIVLGGGSGGLATAQRAAEYGARVVLFEPARLGGTCVNVGCVPKKVMWNASELAAGFKHASDYGFDVRVRGHDWGKLKTGRDAYVARLNGVYQRNLDRKSIALVRSAAKFLAAHEVVDERGEVYRAEHVLIATGGRPTWPDVPGAELGISSDGFFELTELPRRAAVVGSGYIAVELAGVLRSLGSDVSLLIRHERVLRHFDALIGERLTASIREAGTNVLTGAVTNGVTRGADDKLSVTTGDGRQFDGFDTVLWAIGRGPNTASLDLPAAGVARGPEGFVAVDTYQNTNVQGVYAVGDVTGQPELTPVAIAAGRRLADRVFGGMTGRHLRYDVIPTVVFSHPPVGTVGMSEEEARERHPGEAIRVYVADFVPMFYALSERKMRTVMKLVTVGPEERVAGCHVLGHGADEMIQGFAVAVTMGAKKRDFDDTIAIHPTSAEELVTMR